MNLDEKKEYYDVYPDPEMDKWAVGECDCCGAKDQELARVWYGGILETWACQRCRDLVP
jgi:hypothetical protein